MAEAKTKVKRLSPMQKEMEKLLGDPGKPLNCSPWGWGSPSGSSRQDLFMDKGRAGLDPGICCCGVWWKPFIRHNSGERLRTYSRNKGGNYYLFIYLCMYFNLWFTAGVHLQAFIYYCWQADRARCLTDLSVILLGGHYSCVGRLIAKTATASGTGKFKLFK